LVFQLAKLSRTEALERGTTSSTTTHSIKLPKIGNTRIRLLWDPALLFRFLHHPQLEFLFRVCVCYWSATPTQPAHPSNSLLSH